MVVNRKCIGSAKFGIAAHEALADVFPIQPSQKDGLGRMCRPHWTQYTGALRKAALARKAEAPGTDAKSAAAKAAGATVTVTPVKAKKARSKVEHPMAHIGRAASPKARQGKAVIAATESLGGKAYTDAIGSDEVQAALQGGEQQDDTFESDVRAILAKA